MTDEELIAQLNKMSPLFCYENPQDSEVCAIKAAERIEELLKQRYAVMSFNHATNQENYRYQERTRDAEAKLAKAMKLIGLSIEMASFDLNPKLLDDMIYFKTEYELEKTE